MIFSTRLLIPLMALTLVACSATEEAAPSANQSGGDAGSDVIDDDSDNSSAPDGGDDTDTAPEGPAIIDVSPANISFEDVELGDRATQTVTIRNLGGETLHIFDASLTHFDHSGDDELLPGDGWPDETEIRALHYRDFEVVYEPQEAGSIRGELTIFSSDAETPETSVRIETLSAYAELEAPHRLSFGTQAPGGSQTEQIAIYNRGLTPLQVQGAYVDDDSIDPGAFDVEIVGASELPAIVQRNEFLYLDITFSPDSEDTKRGEILVETNDPATPVHTIEVSGNRPEPCLQTSGEIDFGLLADGTVAMETLSIQNCSETADLEISDIEITDDADSTFALVEPETTSFTIDAAASDRIAVQATMNTNQEVVGQLTFSSSDPDAAEVVRQLRAAPAP